MLPWSVPQDRAPTDEIFGQFVGRFDARLVDRPFAGQIKFPGSQLEMAQGDAHIHALEICYPQKTLEKSLAVAGRAAQVKMPRIPVLDNPPRLAIGGRGSEAHHLKGGGKGTASSWGSGRANLSLKNSVSQG